MAGPQQHRQDVVALLQARVLPGAFDLGEDRGVEGIRSFRNDFGGSEPDRSTFIFATESGLSRNASRALNRAIRSSTAGPPRPEDRARDHAERDPLQPRQELQRLAERPGPRRADALHDLAIALDVVAPKGGHEQLARRGMGGPLSTITEFLPTTAWILESPRRTSTGLRTPSGVGATKIIVFPPTSRAEKISPYRLDADSRNHLVRVWVRKGVTMPG